MKLKEHLQMQLAEALGPVNRWFCSQCYGREVTDPDELLEYYIKHGGAEAFARRKAQLAGAGSDSAGAGR
jgi:hypothetical protein